MGGNYPYGYVVVWQNLPVRGQELAATDNQSRIIRQAEVVQQAQDSFGPWHDKGSAFGIKQYFYGSGGAVGVHNEFALAHDGSTVQ